MNTVPYAQTGFVVDRIVSHEVQKPTRLLVRELPAGEQPVNRLRHYGPTALSTAELVAAVLQTPDALSLAHELLTRFEGLTGLIRATVSELCTVNGVGPARAVQLKATLELGRRLFMASPEERPQITSPADAANLIMSDMALLDQEQMWVLVLNTKNYVITIDKVYQGSVNAALVRVSELFRTAIRENAPAIIVAHNHPTHDPTPSPEDVHVTRQIVDAGKLLDIEVLDHLICGGRQRFVSLKERGLGFD